MRPKTPPDLLKKDFDELDASDKFKVLGIPIENCMRYLCMNLTMLRFDNPKACECAGTRLFDRIRILFWSHRV